MAKKNLAKTLQTKIPFGFSVDSITALETDCKRVLRSALGNNSLGFDKITVSGGRTMLALKDQHGIKAEARGVYYVVPLLQGILSENYWISVSLEVLHLPVADVLKGVSLIIFKGGATDPHKVALIRAEWDSTNDISKDAPGLKHAQPHWHIYPSNVNPSLTLLDSDLEHHEPVTYEFDPALAEDEKVVDNEESKEEFNEVVSEWNGGTRFHFAMASQWHISGKEAHCEALDSSDKLFKWLDGCLQYIKLQLIYLQSKASKQVNF